MRGARAAAALLGEDDTAVRRADGGTDRTGAGGGRARRTRHCVRARLGPRNLRRPRQGMPGRPDYVRWPIAGWAATTTSSRSRRRSWASGCSGIRHPKSVPTRWRVAARWPPAWSGSSIADHRRSTKDSAADAPRRRRSHATGLQCSRRTGGPALHRKRLPRKRPSPERGRRPVFVKSPHRGDGQPDNAREAAMRHGTAVLHQWPVSGIGPATPWTGRSLALPNPPE